ncbi:ocia domain-containing protein 1 [Tropilaelaps mercedesae]|uniref:Ocia domain-containing protein 1 n=1 Tax=Tropilaelaps mercedesae TaxID=418985 RepID=A0A1V9XLR7_9ACAR|nr:ocia domain-containing protein 1 [Tropilaelaps mercedesae]
MASHGTVYDRGDRFPSQNPHASMDYDDAVKNVSLEDLRILKECNRQSFYSRCVPLAAISAAATYWSVKAGYLKPHPKLGSAPKIIGAMIVSYIVGKWSYRNVCAEMFMASPNSQMGWYIKQRRGLLSPEEAANPPIRTLRTQPVTATHPSAHATSSYSPDNIRDIDTSRTGSSYSQREAEERSLLDLSPSSGATPSQALPEENAPVRYRSFEDLRRENRSEFAMKRFTPDGGRVTPPALQLEEGQASSPFTQAPQPRASVSSEDFTPGRRFQKKNKYGDLIEE